MSEINFYIMLSGLLFTLGTLGVIIRKNAIVIFMCIELMLNAVNILLVVVSKHFNSVDGQIYVFFIMAVAAAEAAVGLAIILAVFRNYYSINSEDTNLLHG